MRPVIGVLSEIDNERTAKLLSSYTHAVECSGGTPLLLPYVASGDAIEHFISLCDGFLFTGGVDIDPHRYGEEPKAACGEIQLNRDDLDFAVLQKALEAEKPILAICRGAQLVNVALGGTLYQDIPSEIPTALRHQQSEPKFSYSHEVNILAGTPLSDLMDRKERMAANSFHHQAIKVLGRGLAVMATADDGVTEAIYMPDRNYVRAYQWHPERLYDADEFNRRIFDDFVKACRK